MTVMSSRFATPPRERGGPAPTPARSVSTVRCAAERSSRQPLAGATVSRSLRSRRFAPVACSRRDRGAAPCGARGRAAGSERRRASCRRRTPRSPIRGSCRRRTTSRRRPSRPKRRRSRSRRPTSRRPTSRRRDEPPLDEPPLDEPPPAEPPLEPPEEPPPTNRRRRNRPTTAAAEPPPDLRLRSAPSRPAPRAPERRAPAPSAPAPGPERSARAPGPEPSARAPGPARSAPGPGTWTVGTGSWANAGAATDTSPRPARSCPVILNSPGCIPRPDVRQTRVRSGKQRCVYARRASSISLVGRRSAAAGSAASSAPVALMISCCSSSARRATRARRPSISAATISPRPRAETTPGSSRRPSSSRSPRSRTRAQERLVVDHVERGVGRGADHRAAREGRAVVARGEDVLPGARPMTSAPIGSPPPRPLASVIASGTTPSCS